MLFGIYPIICSGDPAPSHSSTRYCPGNTRLCGQPEATQPDRKSYLQASWACRPSCQASSPGPCNPQTSALGHHLAWPCVCLAWVQPCAYFVTEPTSALMTACTAACGCAPFGLHLQVCRLLTRNSVVYEPSRNRSWKSGVYILQEPILFVSSLGKLHKQCHRGCSYKTHNLAAFIQLAGRLQHCMNLPLTSHAM